VPRALQQAEFNLRGLCRADLPRFLLDVAVFRVNRFLCRRRQFGLIKKVGRLTIAA